MLFLYVVFLFICILLCIYIISDAERFFKSYCRISDEIIKIVLNISVFKKYLRQLKR